jgi:uncharacterized membrane protein
MSKFAFAKHPVHPALVALPIGLMMWTFVSDLVYVFSDKDETWYDISLYTGAAAIVTALVAALPGFGDYLTMRMRDSTRRIATAHMLLNLVIVALFAVAFALMLDKNAVDGTSLVAVVALHFVGVGLLGLSGWLGGEMVYVHHLAVAGEVTSDETLRRSAPMHRPGAQPR